jgi:transcriptional regulator with XRE-family HTH domain
MQSIGERLEEARKRKGISLREAAEATKIRSDFLGYIEQNKMDFDLPEIYKRGFLKNYARFLKLDVDKIMTDYNAQQLSNSRLGKKGGSEWFGQMDIKKADSEETSERSESQEPAPYGRIAPKPARQSPRSESREKDPDHPEDTEADKTFYMKIGLIFVGTLALVFVIFGLIWAILGSGDPEDVAGNESGAPDLRDPAGISQPATPGTPEATASGDMNTVILTASGNVYVLVRQQSDNQEILRRTLSAGESVTLEKDGPVDVLFTAGENIVIEQGGERFRPNASGTAKITLQ